MTAFNTLLGRSLGALMLAGCAVSAQADAIDVSFSGQLAYQHDVVHIDFGIASATDLRVWTDSWLAGTHFDPVLALFSSQGALLSLSDDANNPNPAVAAGQGALDAGLLLPHLAAGRYRVTISDAANYPSGATFGDGFMLDGSAPLAYGSNGQPGGAWSMHFGVALALPVPEPTTAALLLAGLLCVAFLASRRQP